ncbi:MAG: glycosyltransferase, partial [Planctomycetota bacterium]|nr:glycosyltransferase [Planctomycetota bacterium]
GEIYRQMDVLVVPSLWWENSPLTIHEAWQFGVPVVVSDRGGMAELASRGGAIVFPPGDVLALAEILQKLSSTPKAVEDLRNTISPVRDISEDVALLEEIYQTLA